jgi:L-fuculose-phosphate aldolase
MNLNMKFKEQRKEVAYFMRRLYKKGLTTTSGGNISMRISEKVIAITPGGLDKGRLKWEEIALMTIDGRNLTIHLKPSLETQMHLEIYRKSPNASGIVHAHPPFASSFTASGREIDTNLTAEAHVIIGIPGLAHYARMGSMELAKIVSEMACNTTVILMENHGVLAVGSSLLQAFDKLEVLEMAAKMNVITALIGDRKPLTKDRMDELDKLFG